MSKHCCNCAARILPSQIYCVKCDPTQTKGGDVKMKGKTSPLVESLTSPEMPAQSRGETLDQHCGQPEGTFKQFMKDSNEPTELQQAIERIKRELVVEKREMQLLLAELDGIYTGLMIHPSDHPCNGCLISEASKVKLASIKELIKRYEQL